jgi:hypothetical protein
MQPLRHSRLLLQPLASTADIHRPCTPTTANRLLQQYCYPTWQQHDLQDQQY